VCNLTASYQRWVATLLSLTDSGGEVNQKKLFHDNAIGIYRLG
jgi:predicted TIM-barrel fold metal-dependent hydrolase